MVVAVKDSDAAQVRADHGLKVAGTNGGWDTVHIDGRPVTVLGLPPKKKDTILRDLTNKNIKYQVGPH